MARIPMVTRTMQTTKAQVLCTDVMAGTSFIKEFNLPRTYKDDKTMLKAVAKIITDPAIKAVHISSSEVEEVLYGMSEQKFMENAEILPPRTVYPVEE